MHDKMLKQLSYFARFFMTLQVLTIDGFGIREVPMFIKFCIALGT